MAWFRSQTQLSPRRGCLLVVLVGWLLGFSGNPTALAAGPKQQHFPSPEAAVQALVAAVKAGDAKTVRAILGPGSQALISSGDPVADRQTRDRFLAAYDAAHRLEMAGDAKAVLSIGKDDWPLPIPVLKQGVAWRFDTQAGKVEILNRRIGRNELNTIQVSLAYVDAQREYARLTRPTEGLPHYAQKFRSAKGKRDGLYWPTQEGEVPSPLGAFVANARAEGYSGNKAGSKPSPYHGYLFRILTAQGKDAPGGALDYVVKGQMIGGFALVAYPARYGVSGVMTFIVNHDGVVYQKDLGPNTEKVAPAMRTYNPDGTWKKVQ